VINKYAFWILLISFSLLILLYACSPSVPSATESSETQGATASGYPYPYPQPSEALHNLSGYPGPQFITPIPTIDIGNVPPLVIPTPSAGMGIVKGQFSLTNTEQRIILIADIFLAPLVYSEGTVSIPFIRLDPDNDPMATLRNQRDEFAFVDVAPGEYGIILHGPVTDYVVPSEDSETGFLIVTVKPGETTDVGIIEIK
jgi:hypothetical protein